MSVITVVPAFKQVSLPRSPATNNVAQGVGIGVVLTILSYVVALAAGWIDSVNYLEAFAVFTSYVATFLCVKERRINYPVGAVSCAAYALVFYQQGLLASTVLNLYLVPTLVYGWFRWRNDADTRPVTRVESKMWPVYAVVTAAFFAGAFALSTTLGGTFAAPDAAILVGTILAQFLLDNKKIETWFVWLAVNCFAIYTYAEAGLALVAFQYVFFLLNVFYGLYAWNKSKNA